MIDSGVDIYDFARRHGVRFIRKDRSWLMRLLAVVLPAAFMTRFWTTVGRRIYYPATGPDPAGWEHVSAFRLQINRWTDYLEKHRGVVEHEFYHVLQFERLWHLHSLFYLVFPLPFGLSWYRWRCERVAYLHQIRHYTLSPEATKACCYAEVHRVVSTIWKSYGWCWPRSWMWNWFLRELGR